MVWIKRVYTMRRGMTVVLAALLILLGVCSLDQPTMVQAKTYPIQRIKPIDAYDADDTKSMEANNTSAFNYRRVEGSTKLSMHSKGLAIDLNPRINPCIRNGKVDPPGGKVY